VAYYLRHRAEIDTYLARQERKAEEVRQRIARPKNVQAMSDDELVQRLWVFVVRDPRFSKLGLHGGARELYRAATGSLPEGDLVKRIVQAFWFAWDEYHAKPRGVSIGGGSPYYPLEGELSTWQENAIRALEDGRDA